MTLPFHHRHIAQTMLPTLQRHLTFSIKSLTQEGVFAGYASVFDVRDTQRDIITRGAFAETIHHRTHEIKLLWQHDMREPIGIIDVLKEDARGLYMQARLYVQEVAKAREAYHLLKEGVVQGLSIGYSPTRTRIDAATRTRIITQLDLWEISLVTFPANQHAQITVVKTALSQENSDLQHALDNAIRALEILRHSSEGWSP